MADFDVPPLEVRYEQIVLKASENYYIGEANKESLQTHTNAIKEAKAEAVNQQRIPRYVFELLAKALERLSEMPSGIRNKDQLLRLSDQAMNATGLIDLEEIIDRVDPDIYKY